MENSVYTLYVWCYFGWKIWNAKQMGMRNELCETYKLYMNKMGWYWDAEFTKY